MGPLQVDLAVSDVPMVELQVTVGFQLLGVEAGEVAARQPQSLRLNLLEIDRRFERTLAQDQRTHQAGRL